MVVIITRTITQKKNVPRNYLVIFSAGMANPRWIAAAWGIISILRTKNKRIGASLVLTLSYIWVL